MTIIGLLEEWELPDNEEVVLAPGTRYLNRAGGITTTSKQETLSIPRFRMTLTDLEMYTATMLRSAAEDFRTAGAMRETDIYHNATLNFGECPGCLYRGLGIYADEVLVVRDAPDHVGAWVMSRDMPEHHAVIIYPNPPALLYRAVWKDRYMREVLPDAP